jgi:hypothetical protein
MARPNDRLSRRQERKLVKIGKRVFAEHFPNPDRIGCPSPDVLKAMAFRRPAVAGRPYPIDHLTICSPCFRQYSRYRAQAQYFKGAHFALIAATVVLALAALVWLSLGQSGWSLFRRSPEIARQPSLPQFQPVTLDLRPLSSPRGERQPETTKPVLALPRGLLRVSFLLPVGSEEGQYEVQMFSGDGQLAVSVRGQARILDYVTTLQSEADLRRLSPGTYTLRISRPSLSWQAYSVALE